MDNMIASLVTLSDQDLMEMEGGVIPIAVEAGIVASSSFAGLSAGVAMVCLVINVNKHHF